MTKLSLNFEKILSRTDGNFENQNKVSESSIIIIIYGIIIFKEFLIKECDKEENLEVTRAANATSCLKRRL